MKLQNICSEKKLIETNYRGIVDFRNQISHEYFGVDEEIVWQIIHQKFEPFENDIIGLINKMEPRLKKELIDASIADNYYLDFVVQSLRELESNPFKGVDTTI